jgi:hypothetical protein
MTTQTTLTPTEKMKKLMVENAGPRDWPEDFSDENGTYTNVCVYCKHEFMGHKRRVVCKWCRPRGAGGRVIA